MITSKFDITIDIKVLTQSNKFEIFGGNISNGKCVHDIKSRKSQAKSVFEKRESIVSLNIRKVDLKCYITLFLLCQLIVEC